MKSNLKFSDKEIEIFARRILPEIKKYFADEEVQKEFLEWKAKLKENEHKSED